MPKVRRKGKVVFIPKKDKMEYPLDIQYFAKRYNPTKKRNKSIRVSKSEYEILRQSVNDAYEHRSEEWLNSNKVVRTTANYSYMIKVLDFNEFIIVKRKKIK